MIFIGSDRTEDISVCRWHSDAPLFAVRFLVGAVLALGGFHGDVQAVPSEFALGVVSGFLLARRGVVVGGLLGFLDLLRQSDDLLDLLGGILGHILFAIRAFVEFRNRVVGSLPLARRDLIDKALGIGVAAHGIGRSPNGFTERLKALLDQQFNDLGHGRQQVRGAVLLASDIQLGAKHIAKHIAKVRERILQFGIVGIGRLVVFRL